MTRLAVTMLFGLLSQSALSRGPAPPDSLNPSGESPAATPDRLALRADHPALAYELSIEPSLDPLMARALKDASMLVALQGEPPVHPMVLITRIDQDIERLDRVLRSFGYYDAAFDARVAGFDVARPELMERLREIARDARVSVVLYVDPGPLYRIGEVRLDGEVPPSTRVALTLRRGQPAIASEVLAGAEAVLADLREEGFPLARVPAPTAIVDHRSRTMDVIYRAEPDERLPLGEIEIGGLERLRERYVRRRLGLQPGEPYSPSRLETARRDLLASEAVSSARLTAGTQADAAGRLPLRVEVVERPPRVLRVAGSYSSDEGGRIAAAWAHRNLLGGAERLLLGLELSQRSAGAFGDLNHSATAALRVPDFVQRDLDLRLEVGAVRERLDAYNRDALMAATVLERRLSKQLDLSAGVALEAANVRQDGIDEDFWLVSVPLTIRWDNSDSPLDPRRGQRLEAHLTPVPRTQGGSDAFLRAWLLATAYLELPRQRENNIELESRTPAMGRRRVLAARLALGRILGATSGAVPPNWRFYAGGGGSVRGFPFQSIGPETADGSPAGGDALVEASVELRQGLGARWEVAAFVDSGAVSEDGFEELRDLAVALGLGVRYHTPVGPIRADLAAPVTQTQDHPSVQLYIGIGQAF